MLSVSAPVTFQLSVVMPPPPGSVAGIAVNESTIGVCAPEPAAPELPAVPAAPPCPEPAVPPVEGPAPPAEPFPSLPQPATKAAQSVPNTAKRMEIAHEALRDMVGDGRGG